MNIYPLVGVIAVASVRHFRCMNLKLVTAIILSYFELTLTDKRPVHPVRRGITIVRSGGVKMVVTKKAKVKRQTISST